MSKAFFLSGKLVTGCNYWASHAGTAMWSDWQPDVIRQDFLKLSQAGMQLIRIFPLWPEFQPLHKLCGFSGKPIELRFGEQPLPDTEAGKAGINPEMVERLQLIADLADEYGLKLAVSLITGWMSGRMFTPPAFESLNLLTDPFVLKWQVRMVRYLVKALKDHSAIVAWSAGNECNCMALANRDQAWLWTNIITTAIRAEDDSRQITSGMHSLVPVSDDGFEEGKSWTIQDQAELTDVLTTHPYPLFTPHAGRDPLNHFRNCFHATAESRFYGEIGGKPCVVEELGTLAAMMAEEDVKAAYIRNTLFNIWAHDCLGLLWWCAFDQLHLKNAPYDWAATERELGLFDSNGHPKPVLDEFTRFHQMLESMPFDVLPQFQRQAICILSPDQDSWGNGWSSFLLAKQAGFDLEFQYISDKLRDSDLYIIPGLNGANSIYRRHWQKLLERVQNGATLYVSLDSNALLSPFEQIFGVKSQHYSQRSTPLEWEFDGNYFQTDASSQLALKTESATVLARESDDSPVFLVNQYGKGKIYLLTVPLEHYLAKTPEQFPQAQLVPYYRIYQEIASSLLKQRLISSGNPLITVTEHLLNNKEVVVIMVNNQPKAVRCLPEINESWQISQQLYGNYNGQFLEIDSNDAAVFCLTRK